MFGECLPTGSRKNGTATSKAKGSYDRAAHGRPYAVDDMVWLHCPAVTRGTSPKLHRYWQGPYRVVRPISDVLFTSTQGLSSKAYCCSL